MKIDHYIEVCNDEEYEETHVICDVKCYRAEPDVGIMRSHAEIMSCRDERGLDRYDCLTDSDKENITEKALEIYWEERNWR